MNILYLLHNESITGANLSFLDMICDLNVKKNNIFVMIPKYNKILVEKLNKMGIKNIIILKYKCYFLNYNHDDFKSKIKNTIKITPLISVLSYLYVKRIYRVIKKLNIDIIHTNSFSCWYGAWIAKKLNIPHIWHIREFMGNNYALAHIHKKRIQKLCNYSNAIYISKIVQEKYDNIYSFKNTVTIYDRVRYNSYYIHQRDYMKNCVCNVLYVGSLDVNKGIYEMLDAFKILQQKEFKTHLFICGEGDLKDYILNYVNINCLNNVHFLGFREDIEDIRKNMDIALMCSNNEALGRTTIEAMYCENLVIGADSDNACTKYLIKDSLTGLLYKKGDSIHLANKIIYSIEHKKECLNMIQKAKEESIQKYSNSISDNIERFYIELKGE